MKPKKLTGNVFNLLICGLGVSFLLTDVLLAYNMEEYYPLNEDNKWIYTLKTNDNGTETTSQEITKIKGTEKFGEVETKKMLSAKLDNQCVAIDSEGVKLYKSWGWPGGDYGIYEPPKMLFPSIEVGESRTYPINEIAYTLDDVVAERTKKAGTLTITLSSVEDVEVPAGKFKDCLKFISVEEYKYVNTSESGKGVFITWLASGIGRVKSSFEEIEYKLDTKEEDKVTDLLELTKASVNGNELPLPIVQEAPPQAEEEQQESQ